jgi:hypothetical protein
VALRAALLLTVNPGAPLGAQLLKLGVERLPMGADVRIAEVSVLRMRIGHILREVYPFEFASATEMPESLNFRNRRARWPARPTTCSPSSSKLWQGLFTAVAGPRVWRRLTDWCSTRLSHAPSSPLSSVFQPPVCMLEMMRTRWDSSFDPKSLYD